MERLRQRWNDGPKTRLLIVCAFLMPLVVLLMGCTTIIALVVYISMFRLP
jgi:hypothetical protein